MSGVSGDGPVDELGATVGSDESEGTTATGSTGGDDGRFLRQVAGMTPAVSPLPIGPGVVIDGTYRIERRLGAGGMGVVFLARDLGLARDVALKVHSQRAAERLAREAKAIAQLVHPNVVTVHEIGTYEGHPFVAMEYLDGGTARTWLAEKARPWREVLTLYLAAARGLAAAHRAGLVHRDFKPDNVLVGLDGRVRVADFGLARDLASIDEMPDGDGGATRDSALQPITATGTVMGTPAYMAPEQHAGEPAGPAADQFAFCVSLWEAWFSQRPFAGTDRATIADAVAAGAIRAPSSDRKVPRRLRLALERGLAADPAARPPSMEALITALARDRRGLVAVAGGAAVLSVAGLAVGLFLAGGGDSRPSCARLADANPVWTSARKAELASVFAASSRRFAASSFDRVAAQLDTYAGGLRAQRIEVCQAHRTAKQSPQLHDLRNLCLDGRRAELAALIDTLAAADDEVIDHAISASRALGDLEACSDVAALSGLTPLPDDAAARDAIARLEVERGTLTSMQAAGKWRPHLPRIRAATTEAATIGYAPLTARLTQLLANFEKDAGEYDAARASGNEALRLAALSHDNLAEVDGWLFQITLVSQNQGKNDEAASLVAAAETALARAGTPPLFRANLDSTVGALRMREGKYPEARQLLDRALIGLEASLGKDDPAVALVLNRLAGVDREEHKAADGEARLRRAAAILKQAYGDQHPNLATTYSSLGQVLHVGGHSVEALQMLQQALEIRESVSGSDHADLIGPLMTIGLAMRAIGRTAETRPYLERALAIARAKLGPDHTKTALVEMNLASVLTTLGDHTLAMPLYRHALEIQEQRLGPAHPELIPTLTEYADVLRLLGDLPAAHALVDRAVAIAKATFGGEGPEYALALLQLASQLDAEGDLRGSLATNRQAAAIVVRALGPDHPRTMWAHHTLGNALITAGQYDEAETTLTELHRRVLERYGADDVHTAGVAESLGRLAASQDRVAEALRWFELALPIIERDLGPDALAGILTGVAESHRELGNRDQAVAAARRLSAILDDPKGAAIPPLTAAESRLVAGRLLYDAGERSAGRASVEQAHKVLAASGHPSSGRALADAESWLRAHPVQ